jgi:hypothetical protein
MVGPPTYPAPMHTIRVLNVLICAALVVDCMLAAACMHCLLLLLMKREKGLLYESKVEFVYVQSHQALYVLYLSVPGFIEWYGHGLVVRTDVSCIPFCNALRQYCHVYLRNATVARTYHVTGPYQLTGEYNVLLQISFRSSGAEPLARTCRPIRCQRIH